jgi:hypothetical protein
MGVAELEAALVDRVDARLQELAVEPWPADPRNYRCVHPVGAVLVRYVGSQYGPPSDVGVMVQERTATFEFALLVRGLRDHLELTAHLEALRRAVQGLKLPGAGKLRLLRDDFVAEVDGEWRHGLRASTTLPAVEEADVDVGEPVYLSRGVARGPFGTVEVPAEE